MSNDNIITIWTVGLICLTVLIVKLKQPLLELLKARYQFKLNKLELKLREDTMKENASIRRHLAVHGELELADEKAIKPPQTYKEFKTRVDNCITNKNKEGQNGR